MTPAIPNSSAGRLRPHTRDATPDDLPAIIRVYLLAYAQPPWNEHNDPAATENYLRWLMAQPRTHFLVATLPTPAVGAGNPLVRHTETTQPDLVVGFIVAGERNYSDFTEDWDRMVGERPASGWLHIPGRLGYVWELGVDPAVQRQGVATTLLGDAIDRLRQDGVENLLLRSSERADAAVALYKHFGFQRLPIREKRDPLAGPWLLPLSDKGEPTPRA
jgi:ribosomal protein S18 acetylase RimI-like enzyme